MSTLKVDGIRSNSASSDAITLASDGTCTANITNRSNRNLIINGAMNVAQRGTSSTSTSYQTVDRIKLGSGGTDENATQAQVDVASGTPAYQAGFRKAFKITNGNQTATDAADHIQVDYFIEAQDLANSGWDYTSSSSYVTLSFWIKSSVAQAFPATFRTIDGTSQVYNMTTGTLSANTWTKITKTIPGNSNVQFDNDNGQGVRLMFFPHIGTTYTTTGLAMDTWSAWSNPKHSFDMATTWWTTDDATYEITGLQLEVGSVATDFEHRSYAQELQLCKRYYQQYPEGPHADNYVCVPSAVCVCNNTTTLYYCPTLNPTMRSSPSFSTSGNFRVNGTASVNNVAVTAIGVYHNGAATPFQYASVASGLTAGQAAALSVNNDANAYIAYSAEL